jgi:ribosome production factor 2
MVIPRRGLQLRRKGNGENWHPRSIHGTAEQGGPSANSNSPPIAYLIVGATFLDFPEFFVKPRRSPLILRSKTTPGNTSRVSCSRCSVKCKTEICGSFEKLTISRKPRNARTARIVKAREPQQFESRKRVLILHGTRCPQPVQNVLKTIHTLTKPEAVLLTKKNENIHPFENADSLEFLAGKNECGVIVFGTHSKKRPNNITVLRTFDGKVLDMVELLLLAPEEQTQSSPKLTVGVEMKPLILFAGSQWDDTSSSAQAALYRSLKSIMLDLFQGEEIPSIDVAGLQYLLMIAAGESSSSSTDLEDPASKPVLHLRWYRIRTMRSNSPKIPRVELDPTGPSFDFRVGRFSEADPSVIKEALKHGRRPNEARTRKNIETDLVGDKIGRVHLGKQDLSTLQTRKMKGLKRSRDAFDNDGEVEMDGEPDEDVISQDEDMENGGVDVDDGSDDSAGSDAGSDFGTGDEISLGDEDEDEDMGDAVDEQNEKPKRQRIT